MKILPGSAVNRQYRNLRNIRNDSLKMFAANLTLAGISAYKKDLPFAVALGALSCLWVKRIEKSANAMYAIRKPYAEILKRTIDIKFSTLSKS